MFWFRSPWEERPLEDVKGSEIKIIEIINNMAAVLRNRVLN
jgi:hypothetical protein